MEGLRIFVKDLDTHAWTFLLAKITLLSNDKKIVENKVQQAKKCHVAANRLLLSYAYV